MLALADAFHGHPQVVCLILKLAGDVVEANISLLEVRTASNRLAMSCQLASLAVNHTGKASTHVARPMGCIQDEGLSLQAHDV